MVLLGVALSAARRDRAGKALKNSPPLGAKKDAPDGFTRCILGSQALFTPGQWQLGSGRDGPRSPKHCP
jgi:hypothetical protein